MLSNTYFRIVLLNSWLLIALTANGQVKQLVFNENDYPDIKFVANAAVQLPRLYQDSGWEKMQNFLNNWKSGSDKCAEIISSLQNLLDMQQNKYLPELISCNLGYYLTDYSRELTIMLHAGDRFKYYLVFGSNTYYDAGTEAHTLLLLTRQWAQQLMRARALSTMELFLCKVYAGDISHPGRYLEKLKGELPELDSMQRQLTRFHKILFDSRRNDHQVTWGVFIGAWMPTGRLQSIMGNHPAFGFQVGGRNRLNEYGLSYSFRLNNTTSVPYQFVRRDSLFNSNYYVGFNVGFDYTRYLLHLSKFDAGFTTGIGVDYFNQYDSNKMNSIYTLTPVNLNSFDFSNGIRLKYFFSTGIFIGIAAKFHWLNYCNKGGTDLSGNAFTLDICFGKN